MCTLLMHAICAAVVSINLSAPKGQIGAVNGAGEPAAKSCQHVLQAAKSCAPFL